MSMILIDKRSHGPRPFRSKSKESPLYFPNSLFFTPFEGYLEPLAGLNIYFGYGAGLGTGIAPAWIRKN